MIGKVYKALIPFYNVVTKKQSHKGRPCLIIGKADSSDYVILPISKINDKTKVDSYYDIPLDKTTYKFLSSDSYLRTHKQTIVNLATLRGPIADFKTDYEATYIDVISKVEEFQKKIVDNAI